MDNLHRLAIVRGAASAVKHWYSQYLIERRARREHLMQQRVKVVGGLLVAAALVGIGIYPVRRGLTVRYQPTKSRRRAKRRAKPGWQRLLFWW
ncbi:MAG: hypothetical protein H7Z42_09075 [Roseiflexaceae bacterium]|nr:hypothetical protein [Roseiflexaceae bacterium]